MTATGAAPQLGESPTSLAANSGRFDEYSLYSGRLPVLDGWRAISILAVLAGHLLPLGPHHLELNLTAASSGMAIFFTLSGFLIVRFLAAGSRIDTFIVRRAARILPLAWLAMFALALWHPMGPLDTFRNLAFYSNLPRARFFVGGEHLWSLCVEMQFYFGVALLCAFFGRRALLVIPLLCLMVTAARIASGQVLSVVTWHRVDEILAGGTLALAYLGVTGSWPRQFLGRLPFWPLLPMLLMCANPLFGPLQYLRPYAAALLIGSTLVDCPQRLKRVLESRPLNYIAGISYALYVIHGVLGATWLGSGDKLVRYAKRPLLFAATFGLAHLSTRYFELPITRFARRFGKRSKPV